MRVLLIEDTELVLQGLDTIIRLTEIPQLATRIANVPGAVSILSGLLTFQPDRWRERGEQPQCPKFKSFFPDAYASFPTTFVSS